MGTSQEKLERRPGPPRAANRSFLGLLPGVFTYPFRGRGKFILLVGAGSLVAIGFTGLIGTLVLGILLGGYMAMYLMEVIGSCAGGDDEPPDWPDLRDVDDTVRPLLLCIGALAIPLAPAGIYRLAPVISGLLAGKAWWEPLSGVAWALLIAGAIYAPMGLLSVTMHQSLAAISPHKVLVAIVRVAPCYVVALTIMAVACIASAVAAMYLSFVPLAGQVLTLYLLLVEGRVLGLIYRTQARRLRWFE